MCNYVTFFNMEAADPKQEFRDLLKVSGWSQAEASRQLCMTPSALSQIVRENSPVNPSSVTLRLFRLLILRDKPEALQNLWTKPTPTAPEKWETDLVASLRKLPPETRAHILKAIAAILAPHLQQTTRDTRTK